MNIFKIKKEERILAISTVLICTALHVLLILSYPTNFFNAILSSASCCILATGSTNCSWTKPAATAPHISWLSC